jgi:regulatory protein
MRISRIAQQQKNLDRVSVFIDGKYSFSLNLDQLLESKLKDGLDIQEDQIARFKKMSEEGKLKMRTLEWLMIRPRSAKELRDYLVRKKLAKEQIDNWQIEFSQKKYQDDEYFAKWWIDQRRYKNRSTASIKYELKTKGIDGSIIDNLLLDSSNADKEALRKLIIKKRRQSKYREDKKLIEYLMRLGYHYSLIKEVLGE